jgi:hypothetical protein
MKKKKAPTFSKGGRSDMNLYNQPDALLYTSVTDEYQQTIRRIKMYLSISLDIMEIITPLFYVSCKFL